MSQSSSNAARKENIAKIALSAIFLGGFALFTGWMLWVGPGLNLFNLTAMQLVLLAFSTFRLGRLIAYDRVMEPFRQFFTETVPDPSGAGETVEPKGEGFQNAIGQLICCPICAGTWVAALLTYLLYLFPAPTMVFLTLTAAIGAAEVLGALTEALSWNGQAARNKAGLQAMEREAMLAQRGHPVAFPERTREQEVDSEPETYHEYHR
jgi:hypothetical protein